MCNVALMSLQCEGNVKLNHATDISVHINVKLNLATDINIGMIVSLFNPL